MKSLAGLFIFLFIGIQTFAQTTIPSDTSGRKAQNSSVNKKILTKEDQVKKPGQDLQKQEDKKENQVKQDIKYTEDASGVRRSIHYKFSTLLPDGDPGNGIFRCNNNTLSKVTWIFIDNNDLSGEDQTNWYSTWDKTTGATARGSISIVEYEGRNVINFNVTGVFVKGEGYWKFPVEYISGSLPANGTTYYFIFNRIAHKKPQPVQEPQPVQPPQPVQEPQPVQPTQAKQTSQATQPAQTTQAKQTTQATQTTQTTQTMQPSRMEQPVQVNQPVVVQNIYETTKINHRKWYSGIIEIGYALGVGNYGINNFRFNFINGIKIGQYSSIGLGIGYRRYFEQYENYTDRSLFSPGIQIPVFLDLRTSFSTRKVTPYLAIGIGNSAGYDTTKTRQEGLFFSTSAGIWFNISDRFAVFAGGAFELQKLEYVLISDNSHYKKNTSSISLNIGISF